MARKNTALLRPGYRVHFPGLRGERGTVMAHDTAGDNAFVIVWDRREGDSPLYDIDECDAAGMLYTVELPEDVGQQVVVTDRGFSHQQRKKRVKAAEERIASGNRAQERLDAKLGMVVAVG